MTSSPPAKKRRVADLLGADPILIQPAIKADESATVLKADGSWAAAQAITKQFPDVGIPLTILTGFLGAGKSTVLNYILRTDHGLRIAVLINEFGAVDIDNQLVDTAGKGAEGDPVMLNNGCVCCTISNGFIDAVHKILDRPFPPPHYFILETSGVADPKPIIDSVANTELRGELYVDQVLTVVDSSSWNEKHYDSEAAYKQLLFADTLLLSKTDLVKQDQLQNVVDNLMEIKPSMRILKSQQGYVPITALFDIDLTKRTVQQQKKAIEGAKQENGDKSHEHEGGHKHEHKDGDKHEHKEEHKHEHKEGEKHEHKGDNKHEHKDGDKHEHNGDHKHKHKDDHKHEHKHDHSHDHKHDHKHDPHAGHNHGPGEECEESNHLERDGFSSISFTSKKSFSLYRFKNEFMEDLPEEVFRAKGLLWFKNYDSRFIFHWSGQRFNVEEDEWPEGKEKSNQLVVIGRKMDKDLIMKMLENCLTRDDDPDEDEFGRIYDDEAMYDEDGAMDTENGVANDGVMPVQPQQVAAMVNQGVQLAALKPVSSVEGVVQLPKINTFEGNGTTEGDTSTTGNKLPAVASLISAAPSTVAADAVAQPAQTEGNGEQKKAE